MQRIAPFDGCLIVGLNIPFDGGGDSLIASPHMVLCQKPQPSEHPSDHQSYEPIKTWGVH